MQKPSPKVIKAFFIVVLIVILVIAYNNKPEITNQNEYQKANLQIGFNFDRNQSAEDLDQDSLSDWEEVLWGTDKNNPDSDGDGTKDGTEVALGRNPTKPGPNDKLTSPEGLAEEPIKIESEVKEDSITAKTAVSLAKQVFNSGNNLGDISIDKIIEDAKSTIQIREKYNQNNLLKISDATNEEIRQYGNDFAQIFAQEIFKMDGSKDKSLEVYIAGYKNMALRLSTIRVPEEISGIHLDFINSIDISATLFQVIADSNSDPMKSYLILPEYKEYTVKISESLLQIATYLNNNDIIFTSNEPGIMLFGGIKSTE